LQGLLDEAVEAAKRAYGASVKERRERGEEVPDFNETEARQLYEV
jgi:hypothetical protein